MERKSRKGQPHQPSNLQSREFSSEPSHGFPPAASNDSRLIRALCILLFWLLDWFSIVPSLTALRTWMTVRTSTKTQLSQAGSPYRPSVEHSPSGTRQSGPLTGLSLIRRGDCPLPDGRAPQTRLWRSPLQLR